MIGKPYAGKLHVWFDEGELEIEPIGYTPVLYSTKAVTGHRYLFLPTASAHKKLVSFRIQIIQAN